MSGGNFKSIKRLIRDRLAALRAALESRRDPAEILDLERRLQDEPPTHVRCLEPFRRLEFLERGLVSSCCPAYTCVHSVGNIQHSTIEEIWNGPALQRIRRRLFLGATTPVCRPFCPHLRQAPIAIAALPERTENDRRLKADLAAGRTRLTARPSCFVLSNWGACNLRCVMCESWRDQEMPAHVRRTHELLQAYFDEPVTLMLTGAGDPLARADTRELLFSLSRQPNPNIQLEILTNGLLWTEETWERIRNCRIRMINVSIDAATAATYEKIRRGAKWERLLQALDLIRRARDERAVGFVVINMTVMRSNYREIPAFIQMARERGFQASFEAVRGAHGDENIFTPPDSAALRELAGILADPALYGPDVNLAGLRQLVLECGGSTPPERGAA